MERSSNKREAILLSVSDLFSKWPDEAVFPALAKFFSTLSSSCLGILLWPGEWGKYHIAIDGTTDRKIGADVWDKITKGISETTQQCKLNGLPGVPQNHLVYVVPLRRRNAVIGFAGVMSAQEHDARSALEQILSATDLLQSMTMIRVNELRGSAMREIAEKTLKNAESRFMDFFANSLDMIYISDPAGLINLVNDAGCELVGLPRDQIVGKTLAGISTFPEVQNMFLQRITLQGKVKDFEVTFKRPDGTMVHATQSASAVYSREGAIVEIHGIIRDITTMIQSQRELWKANMDLGKTNANLLAAQKMLVRQEKLASIGQLAAGIAHEINNPLGFTISDFSFLKTATMKIADHLQTSAECQKTINGELSGIISDLPSVFSEMEEGFNRIADIVKNLRSFARSGENEAMKPYDLNEGARRATTIARNEIKYTADVNLELNATLQPPARMGEIDQVLLNVVVNAAQAIAAQQREDRGTIIMRTGDGENSAWIEIEDDGPGIPETIKERMFEPFFTTKETGKGTGLGLSISYNIISNKHGGQLTFRSAANGGTVFRVELPLTAKGENSDTTA